MTRRKKLTDQKALPTKPTREGKFPVSKMEAARCQLETGVSLWFHDGDPISIHTLAMAAHSILRVLNKGGPPMLGEPSPNIRREFSDEWRRLFSADANFFKHSSKDPTDTCYFSPLKNWPVIVDAIECYRRLSNEECPSFRLFKWYLMVHEPRLFKDTVPMPDPDLKALSKPQFWNLLLPLAANLEANWILRRAAGKPTPG